MTPIPLPVGFVEQLIDTAPERLKFAAVRLPSYAAGQALRESGPFAGHPRVPVVRWTDHAGFGASVRRDVEITLPRSEFVQLSKPTVVLNMIVRNEAQ